jgi:hypothetical protein
MNSSVNKILNLTMKVEEKTMQIDFGCVDLSDSELIERFKKQNLQNDEIEGLLKKHIWHDFKVPDELFNQIDLFEFKIWDIDLYNVDEDYISFDVSVQFKFRLLNKNSIKKIKDYQSSNNDLRANISIYWKTVDGKKILFDSWWKEDIKENIESGDWF